MSSDCTGGHNNDRSDVRNCFEDFCKQTILHGWHYLAEREAYLLGSSSDNSDNDSSDNSDDDSSSSSDYSSSDKEEDEDDSEKEVGSRHYRAGTLKRRKKPAKRRSALKLGPRDGCCSCCCPCYAASQQQQDQQHGVAATATATAVLTECGSVVATKSKKESTNTGQASSSTALMVDLGTDTYLDKLQQQQSKKRKRRRRKRKTRKKRKKKKRGFFESDLINKLVSCSISTFRISFWSLVVTMSVLSGGFFLHDNTREFLNSTVQTTLDGSVPLSEVFFPSVVVCNINQIRKSFFAELGFYENDTLVRIMYEDFIKGTDHEEYNMGDPEGDYRRSDPKRAAFYDVCDDMFMSSKWNGTTTYGFGNNERDFGTDYGICCWYTPQLNFSAIPDDEDTDWAFWFNSVPRGAKTGKENGFSVLFDIESFDYGYYDEGSEGLKVAVVHHLDMPIIRQRAFHVAPGTENQIPVTPTLYIATDQSLERFTPTERDCYKEDEIDLKYLPKSHGYRYEMSNCLFEAAYEKILETCQCAPGFHNEGGAAAYEVYPVCEGKNLTCSNNILNRMGEFNEVHDIIENKTKICLTNCEDQVNDLFVTTSSYPNKKTFREREEFCMLIRKLIVTCSSHKRQPLSSEYPLLCPTLEMESAANLTQLCGEENRWRTERLGNATLARAIEQQVYNYAKSNLAVINIFIKEPYSKRFRKAEKMSRISYIASSGGLLGLCMGFSFVSLAEIAYHCCLCFRIICGRFILTMGGKSTANFMDSYSQAASSDKRSKSLKEERNGRILKPVATPRAAKSKSESGANGASSSIASKPSPPAPTSFVPPHPRKMADSNGQG